MLVKPAAASRTPSSRCWSSPWLDASIAAWVTPSSASSASSAVQRDRLGRRVRQRRRHRALDADRAEVHRALAQRLPDLPGEARDRGLAVGAGDRDHHLGLRRRTSAPRPAPAPGAASSLHDHRHAPAARARPRRRRSPSASVSTAAAPMRSAQAMKAAPCVGAARQRREQMPRLHVRGCPPTAR